MKKLLTCIVVALCCLMFHLPNLSAATGVVTPFYTLSETAGQTYNYGTQLKVVNTGRKSLSIQYGSKKKTVKPGYTSTVTLLENITLKVTYKNTSGIKKTKSYKYKVRCTGYTISDVTTYKTSTVTIIADKGFTVSVKANCKSYTIKSGMTKTVSYSNTSSSEYTFSVDVRAKNNKTGKWLKSYYKTYDYILGNDKVVTQGTFSPDSYYTTDFQNGGSGYVNDGSAYTFSINLFNTNAAYYLYYTTKDSDGNVLERWEKKAANSGNVYSVSKTNSSDEEVVKWGIYVVVDGVKSTTHWYSYTLKFQDLQTVINSIGLNGSVSIPDYETAVNNRSGYIRAGASHDGTSVASIYGNGTNLECILNPSTDNVYRLTGYNTNYSQTELGYVQYTLDGSDPYTSSTAVKSDILYSNGLNSAGNRYYYFKFNYLTNGVFGSANKTIKFAYFQSFVRDDGSTKTAYVGNSSYTLNLMYYSTYDGSNETLVVDGASYLTLYYSPAGLVFTSAPHYVWAISYDGSTTYLKVPVGQSYTDTPRNAWMQKLYSYNDTPSSKWAHIGY